MKIRKRTDRGWALFQALAFALAAAAWLAALDAEIRDMLDVVTGPVTMSQ